MHGRIKPFCFMCLFFYRRNYYMGILPHNYLNNQINTYDPSLELKRQLSTRQAQLDQLNSRDTLSKEQLKRKQDLEQTVSMLSTKLEKKTSPSSSMTFPEGKVVPKNPSVKNVSQSSIYAKPNNSDNSYLKGFFFDARI